MIGNQYKLLGISLCVAGAIFAPITYFIINSVPLTAIGMSAIMIGFASIALANTRPYLSPEACQMMMRAGMENTAALVEELGLSSKAVYLPSKARDGKPQALIPLAQDGQIQWAKQNIPGRLIVRYGSNPGDMAIAVATPGSVDIGLLQTRPGPTADEIQAASSYILVGVLDIANSVTVHMTDGQVEVEVDGSRIPYENAWYFRCLGSPTASIVAAISSEALDRPVRVKEETFDKGKGHIVLEVLEAIEGALS